MWSQFYLPSHLSIGTLTTLNCGIHFEQGSSQKRKVNGYSMTLILWRYSKFRVLMRNLSFYKFYDENWDFLDFYFCVLEFESSFLQRLEGIIRKKPKFITNMTSIDQGLESFLSSSFQMEKPTTENLHSFTNNISIHSFTDKKPILTSKSKAPTHHINNFLNQSPRTR